MKKLLLTALATEQSFFPAPGKPAGDARYFLVFNNGELRVEVSESAAESVVAAMVEDGSKPTGFSAEEIEEARVELHKYEAENYQLAPVGESTDEDGVDQI
jgi:hypothetical protein